MANDSFSPEPSLDDLPMVEVLLNIGDSVRIGDRVLRLMDIDGEESMLRVEPEEDDNLLGDFGWTELPR